MATLQQIRIAKKKREKAARKKTSKSKSSSRQEKQIFVGINSTGTIETRRIIQNGRTTTTFTDRRTGRSRSFSGTPNFDQRRKAFQSIAPPKTIIPSKKIEQQRIKLREEQKKKGLRIGIQQIKTKKIIQAARTKVNKEFEGRKKRFEKKHGPVKKPRVSDIKLIDLPPSQRNPLLKDLLREPKGRKQIFALENATSVVTGRSVVLSSLQSRIFKTRELGNKLNQIAIDYEREANRKLDLELGGSKERRKAIFTRMRQSTVELELTLLEIINIISQVVKDPIILMAAVNAIRPSNVAKFSNIAAASSKQNKVRFITNLFVQGTGIKPPLSSIVRAVQRFSPKFTKFADDKIIIKDTPFNNVKDFLKSKSSGRIFPNFKKNPSTILKVQTVKTGATTLSKQAKLAGQEITAVNVAASRLTTWLKRKQIIRKPIPGEANFPKTIITLLNKFDSGIKISKKDFAKINLWLQRNVAPNITLLERSLYADPKSGFRISRLGITPEKTATFKNILKGNFKLLSEKPQVLVFLNAKVAKFPNKLKDIEKKLKKDKKLTTAETNRLIAWQVETGSGKFKPIGSTIFKGGVELEVTLAPGEFIQRIKRIGFTFIEKKKVDIVSAKIWTPPKTILDKITKAKQGKLTDKAVLELEKTLSKKLGTKTRIETPKNRARDIRSNIPVLRVKGKRIRVASRTSRKTTRRKSTPRKTTRRKSTPRKSTPRKPTPRKPTPRKPTPRKPTPRKPTPRKSTPRKSTPKKPTPRKGKGKGTGKGGTVANKPIIPLRLKLSNLKKKGKRQGYIVRIKEGSKIISKSSTPLPKNRAINLMRRKLDNLPQASGDIVPKGKTSFIDVATTILKKKFRGKRSKKTKVLIQVEKRKFRLDKPGEKAISRKPKRKIKTKNTRKVKVVKKRKKVARKRSKK